MPRQPGRKSALFSSRRGILDLLKIEGPSDSQALASRLGVSAMAVRQHLYSLHEEKVVTYTVEGRPFGRPAKVWQLAPAAEGLFPNAHAELSVNLVVAVTKALGKKRLDRTLAVIACQDFEFYDKRMPPEASFSERLETLARVRAEQGYLAQVQAPEEGAYALIQNHCPIRSAAAACPSLCRMELETFQRLLGPDAVIERREHIPAGDRRCLYLIQHRPEPA